jgi:hypothetical protein
MIDDDSDASLCLDSCSVSMVRARRAVVDLGDEEGNKIQLTFKKILASTRPDSSDIDT